MSVGVLPCHSKVIIIKIMRQDTFLENHFSFIVQIKSKILTQCNSVIHLYSSPQSPIISNKLFDFVHTESISS